jgi:hypothetical protein
MIVLLLLAMMDKTALINSLVIVWIIILLKYKTELIYFISLNGNITKHRKNGCIYSLDY